MKNLQIEEIYELYSQTSGVCTDTRSIVEGGMFFALKGETFNGNRFAQAALDAGAAYAVVDEAWVEESNPDKFILVEDVLVALQQISRYHRKRFKIPVIALTGTNGKTTTKELIAACLGKKYNVIATRGNLNNHIGVPLTLLRIDSSTLVKLVCPSFGLITNVGKAHLQGFGSFEGVMATKGELYDNLQEHRKIAFVNVDNPILSQMAVKRQNMHIVPYGLNNDSARIIVDEGGSPFLTMVIPNPCFTAVNNEGKPEWITVRTNLIGGYNADNVLAALCVASYMDVSPEDAVAAIEEYVPSNNRSQLTKTERNSLIVDAYNANPTSMKAAIENFAALNMPGKVLILGDMLELGADSLQEHKGILSLAVQKGFGKIFLVGSEFAAVAAQVDMGGVEYALFEDSLKLQELLKEKPLSGCSVLIKGSRGKRLERVIEAL